jgi:hypothetical protein
MKLSVRSSQQRLSQLEEVVVVVLADAVVVVE